LLACADGNVARTCGFAANVEKVGALLDHAHPLRHGSVTIVSQPIAAERIRGDVDDAHHVSAAAPLEPAASYAGGHDVQDESPRNLRFRRDPCSCEQDMTL